MTNYPEAEYLMIGTKQGLNIFWYKGNLFIQLMSYCDKYGFDQQRVINRFDEVREITDLDYLVKFSLYRDKLYRLVTLPIVGYVFMVERLPLLLAEDNVSDFQEICKVGYDRYFSRLLDEILE